jgi:hypothetical protein
VEVGASAINKDSSPRFNKIRTIAFEIEERFGKNNFLNNQSV